MPRFVNLVNFLIYIDFYGLRVFDFLTFFLVPMKFVSQTMGTGAEECSPVVYQ